MNLIFLHAHDDLKKEKEIFDMYYTSHYCKNAQS